MPVIPAPTLERLCSAVFSAAGAPPDIAAQLAASLVAADLCGHESHGVMRIGRYLERVRDGSLQPAARPYVAQRGATHAIVDGRWGFGQIGAQLATEVTVSICREHQTAAVALRHAHHVGRLGAYVEAIAREGQIGIMMTAGGVRGGSVAPYGGRDRLLGTNPLAVAVPGPAGEPPIVLDFATSALAEGKLAIAHANHQPIDPGAIIDSAGRPSTDPGAFYAGGALLPFGGHKGSALMVMIEIIASTLAGSAPIALEEYRQGNPTVLLAFAVDAFVPRDVFVGHVGALVERIRCSQPAAGFREVLVPGDRENRCAAERRHAGIPLSDATWGELRQLATSLNVPLPPGDA